MTINRELLDKIAHLARLEIDDKDAGKIMEDMNAILAWVEKLKEVDTKNVKPLTSMSFELNTLREDIIKSHLDREQALQNAPQKDEEFFRVPKVLE